MNEKRAKRKLTAILSADVKGYSRLMADDEEATVSTINTYREVMTGLIKDHLGRVVDAKGDNVLAEFSSVVDAVRCAVQVQKELTERNSELSEHRRMEFRIGINLGDVIEEQETIYGDGVNVAARLEGLAEGGGICISGTAFDHVKNRISVGYEYQGKQSVKNIPDPVRLYKVLLEPEAAGKVIGDDEPRPRKKRWVAIAAVVVLALVAGMLLWNYYVKPDVEPASEERMAYPLPDKPSIAVLPFTNMSGDPDQDYIGDGITENIISILSKIGRMFVIARNSSFTYKGKPTKVQQVAEELGVQYVLEGSFQKSKNRLRVTAQLVDALSGHHLWSERYDREMEDLFDLQDEITKKIVLSLLVEISRGEAAIIEARSTDNLDAWSNVSKGYDLFMKLKKEDMARARALYENATKSDPGYAPAWAWLAQTHLLDVTEGWSDSPFDSIKRANEYVQKALSLDGKNPTALNVLGNIYLIQRNHEKAISILNENIALNPNVDGAYAVLAVVLFFSGRFEESVEMIKKSMRLCPYYPPWYLEHLGRCYIGIGRYDEAIEAFNRLKDRCRKGECATFRALVGLAVVYVELGREEEARDYMAEALKANPKLSLESAKRQPFKNPSDLHRLIEAYRKAGMPEKAPKSMP